MRRLTGEVLFRRPSLDTVPPAFVYNRAKAIEGSAAVALEFRDAVRAAEDADKVRPVCAAPASPLCPAQGLFGCGRH